MIVDKKTIVNNLINDIRVHSGILVLGAGASFEAGLPLYAQFPPIVWQVIDEFPYIKTALGHNEIIPAKDIIGDDITKTKQVFSHIEKGNLANSRFKELFKGVNDKHKNNPSIVHENICKLIHSGHIKLVVSFNWDDLLETAWEHLYGTNINDNKINLIKPHGDVRNTNDRWIYPNCAGYLSGDDISKVDAILKNGPSTFIVMGYSEQDRIIADTFIKPNENKYVMYRVSPSSSGENAIVAKASEITNDIFDSLNKPPDDLWIRLDFSNQVGLEHAIMGHRLLPSDVLACPRLPQLKEAKIKLEQAHSVIIEGSPGSGKSISAYQLAWDYLKQGWEILKLDTSKLDSYKNRLLLINDGYKTIFIIDDAQQLDKEQVVELMTKANKNSKLIITQTVTSNFPMESVTLSQKQAVETLYEHYKQREKEILPIIKETNRVSGRSVGNAIMDTPFKFVLDVAQKEDTAWLFNYSLRGGWESTSNQYAVAKEHNRADLLLMLISIKQILTLDKPVNKTWLISLLIQWGHTEKWVLEQLSYLYQQKLIIDLQEIRTLHLQMAIRVIANYLKQLSDDDESVRFYTFLRREFLDEANPLLGIAWFFNMLFSFDVKYKLQTKLFTDEFNENLLGRCSQQTESEFKSHASFVIDRVLRREAKLKFEDINANDNFLTNWIENVDNQTAYSFSQILNSINNESREWKRDFVSNLNYSSIIENIKNIEDNHLYDWAQFLNRLLCFPKTKWTRTFCNQIPKKEISASMQKCKPQDIYGLSEMLCTLRFIDDDYCFDEYHKCIWIIEKAMKQDFMKALRNLDLHFSMYLLGEELFDVSHPNKKQKEAGQAFVDCISSEMLKTAILEGNARDWDTLYRYSGEIFRYDSQKFTDAFKDVDVTVLDSETEDMWQTQPDELIKLLYMLYPCNETKVEEWVYSKRDQIKIMDTGLIRFSPRTTEYVYNNDGLVTLAKSHRWEMNASAVVSLKKHNKKLCFEIIEANLVDIKQSLYDFSNIAWEEYHLFLNELIKVYPNIIDTIISVDDIDLIEGKWANSLKDEYYKHQIKGLKGFQKLTILIKENTKNQALSESMERVEKRIRDILLVKPIKY